MERNTHWPSLVRHRKLLGSLVDVEDINREYFAIARSVRDAFLAVPDRLAPLIAAAASDPRRVHELLSTEIETVLQGLADDFGHESQNGSGSGTPSSPDATP